MERNKRTLFKGLLMFVMALKVSLVSRSAAATPARGRSGDDIDKESQSFVALVQFDLKPEEIDDHVDNAIAFIKDYVRHQPGFISANLHVRQDNHQFMNYTEWEDEDLYERFVNSVESQEGFEQRIRHVPKISKYRYLGTIPAQRTASRSSC